MPLHNDFQGALQEQNEQVITTKRGQISMLYAQYKVRDGEEIPAEWLTDESSTGSSSDSQED